MEYLERTAVIKAVDSHLNAVLSKASENVDLEIGTAAGYDMAHRHCIDLIRKIPAADVVPVVRCKDCKYRQDDDFCGGRGWPAQLVPDDGYCDRAVRKDSDDNG